MNDKKTALNLYLKELYRYPVLTKDEEIDLARRIQDNDDHEALTKLVNHNLRIVVWLVKRESSWDNSKVPLDDIIALGNEQLFYAALKWDPNGKARFSAFAKQFISMGVRRGVAKTENIITLPVGITEKIRKLQYTERVLTQKLGRPPKTDELANETGFSAKRITTLKTILMREPVSLDALTGSNQTMEEADEH